MSLPGGTKIDLGMSSIHTTYSAYSTAVTIIMCRTNLRTTCVNVQGWMGLVAIDVRYSIQ